MLQIIRRRATSEQMQQMLEALGIYIKLAVDIEREIPAGGGELHADYEQMVMNWELLKTRYQQASRAAQIEGQSLCLTQEPMSNSKIALVESLKQLRIVGALGKGGNRD
ncbi:DUF5674 family protein [Vasconcelosia minhoensis]|nr:DUF5674 family protein [Romeria gracilis]